MTHIEKTQAGADMLRQSERGARSGVNKFAAWFDDRLAIFFLMPGLACLSSVILYPVVYNAIVGFTNASLMFPGAQFVGLRNFEITVSDPLFWRSVFNTLVWTAASVTGQLLLGLITALALERVTVGRTALRLALIVPWAFPSIVMAFAWRFMLDPLYGVMNHFLMLVGLADSPQPWLGSPNLAMPTVVLMNIWFGFPFMMVAIVAGLQSIPRELYEAAEIDGAGAWQQFRFVTLPGLWQIIAAVVILRTIWVFNNFDFIFLTTGGGPVDATTTLPIYAYSVGWHGGSRVADDADSLCHPFCLLPPSAPAARGRGGVAGCD
jgi:multiple sugar transport system permease protein